MIASPPPWFGSSLCSRCAWVRMIATPKGSRFLLCERAVADSRFSKYPPQPVGICAGFEAARMDEESP